MEKGGPMLSADPGLLVDSFRKCRKKDGTISTDHYLCAYNELIRLIEQTDRKLFFVISEVEGAIKSLEILRVSGSRCYYDNLDGILSYEAREGIIIKQGNLMSGSNSIFVLHRNLEFMLSYLERMKECALSGRSFSNSQRISVYKETLGTHHGQAKQTSHKMALILSSGKRHLGDNLTKSTRGIFSADTMLSEIITSANPIQQRLSELLLNNGMGV